MAVLRHLATFLGRLCICAIFLGAGINKLLDWQGTMQFMTAKGMTNVSVLLVGAVFFELLGGLMILTGYWTRFGNLFLVMVKKKRSNSAVSAMPPPPHTYESTP